LLLRFAALSHKAHRRYVTSLFARYGIESGRLVLRPGTDRQGILRTYEEVDIALDSWPFCGGSSTAEALWQGVPVVTLRGDRFASAYGASMLMASGLHDLVASSPDDYIAIASRLAADSSRLVQLRAQLRTMVCEHGFSDVKLFASRLEAAFETMLDDQLRRQPWGRQQPATDPASVHFTAAVAGPAPVADLSTTLTLSQPSSPHLLTRP
jgi:protein O-GlcNAc transferase